MKIVLSGVETNNKGAELMLYAILQEVERKFSEAEVYIDRTMIKQGLEYVKTSVNLKYIPEPSKVLRIVQKFKVAGILNRLGFYSRYLNYCCPVKNADYFIDGSGLLFSDKRIKSKFNDVFWSKKLSGYKKHGTKIVFLPQGFGPLKNNETINTINALDIYSDLIFAREEVSYNCLMEVVKNKDKVKISTDFTSLVNGCVPEKYSHLANKVCLIPNFQMISQGILTKENYFNVLNDIILTCRGVGQDVYFLNHEGIKDEKITKEFIAKYDKNIEFINGLNALEVKGLISTAYMVVSSRFHGVASALNGHVPCLATSWHHKYAELFKDFGMTDCVLTLDNVEQRHAKIKDFLMPEKNKEIRDLLISKKSSIVSQNKAMWSMIWSI